jgi:hypothetical protein
MPDAVTNLCADLGIEIIPCNQTIRPMKTKAVNVLRRIFERHGQEHLIMVVRTIVESEGNAAALTEPTIIGISELLLAHPQWGEQGLAWIEAFDGINLKELAAKASANRKAVTKSAAIATMLYERLQPIFSPPKPQRVRKEYVYKRGPRKPKAEQAAA